MMKLNIAWDLGPVELTEECQAVYDAVAPAFIQRDKQRTRKQPAQAAAIFRCLSPLEMEFLQNAGSEINLSSGTDAQVNGLCIVIEGQVACDGSVYGPGDSLCAESLLTRGEKRTVQARQDSCVFHLSLPAFDALCDRHPRLGITLYRCLGAHQR